MNSTYVIIMAGGVGTRFWPFSRTSYPKQFHDVLGTGRTLLQQTADRFDGVCPPENIFIVTSSLYKDLCQQQLPQLTDDQILCEPVARNTAPCIAYACYKIAQRDPQANIVVAPADHIILKEEEFKKTIRTALNATAGQDILVTLGIQPSRPDTGYGYIQYLFDPSEIKRVKTFTEKPNLELAQQFLDSGEFVWNAGIFVWNVQAIITAFEKYLPDVAEIFAEGNDVYYTDREEAFIDKAYSLTKSISIDNGVMERADNVHVVLSDFGWSDLGTWKSLYEVSDKNGDQNVVDGHVMLYDTKNCIIKTPKDRLVAINGLDGFIVAEYDNVLMICRKEDEQKVKNFVADAKEKGTEFV
ncbi:mannose-1-phosphate guanylyltransferase [Spirosoma montaniterrae]|uniref:mannose-1-phosphate guanylyltransferase n=1 Tax=Spirosoma montaniterrae TaxID=1178516 RepID=A0A1P9X180_9BACT|nr:mannose-1-phosphate guanylyltransferase [Spirosoma montaniterrae]AQG81335.1 mannose-1-phosphate guanylyltransferase [Spirosoma montaniterrae]